MDKWQLPYLQAQMQRTLPKYLSSIKITNQTHLSRATILNTQYQLQIAH